ncbi:MAG: CDP-diacylglycerol--serine O-phosphatidyltransferase [Nitrospinae bacterium]|nr:CDP-diacylglycerol--serine O-phosphatidyltransferase [Nitrospinota bacterium]
MDNVNIKKGVFLLPSLLSCMNIFCGFYAIIASFNHKYYHAAIAILLAIFFDILDGRVARMTNTTSEFGLQLDSLADTVSFCIAPGVLSYVWVLTPFGRIGWMAAFLYVICGILRLARFNVQSLLVRGKYFIGLPTPAAAGFIASLIIFMRDVFSFGKIHPIVLVITVYLLAFLMVSKIKYQNFKQLDLREKKPFSLLVFAVLAIYITATVPQIMFFLFACAYILSGPVERFAFSKKSKDALPLQEAGKTQP